MAARLLATWIFLLAALPVIADAAEGVVKGELTTKSPAFQGYRYSVFRFEAPQADATIAMRSNAFDSFLLLVDPEGRLLQNDDHSLSVDKLGTGDAGLNLPGNVNGTWTLVATTLSPNSTGAFDIYTEGLPSPVSPDSTMLEREILARAFTSRGVEDSEAVRQSKIAAIAEQLSLASYRDELTQRLRKEIERRESGRAEAQTWLSEQEAREAELSEALKSSETLTSSRDVIRSIVERELETKRAELESSAATSLTDIFKIEANTAALDDLTELNTLAGRLAGLDEALLQSRTPQKQTARSPDRAVCF